MSKGSKQSYHGINYNLRSSKSIERKIILEAIRGICEPHDLKKFGYVGFGSPFYADFRLIHKELGINWMVCIEGNAEDEDRFLFNKPYKCIELHMGMSNEILPDLHWKCEKNMVWLDYDKPLQSYMFEDLDILAGKLAEGSFLVLTCNGTLPTYKKDVQKEDGRKIIQVKIDDFKKDFERYCPLAIEQEDFYNNNVPKLLREMFTNCINEKLSSLNSVEEENEKMRFIQLFNIRYKDNAPMFTFGGVFIKQKNLSKFFKNQILKTHFIQLNEHSFYIEAPVLTNKETDLMNQHLPSNHYNFIRAKKLKFIPEEMRSAYHSFYRHFPNYMEVKDF